MDREKSVSADAQNEMIGIGSGAKKQNSDQDIPTPQGFIQSFLSKTKQNICELISTIRKIQYQLSFSQEQLNVIVQQHILIPTHQTWPFGRVPHDGSDFIPTL